MVKNAEQISDKNREQISEEKQGARKLFGNTFKKQGDDL